MFRSADTRVWRVALSAAFALSGILAALAPYHVRGKVAAAPTNGPAPSDGPPRPGTVAASPDRVANRFLAVTMSIPPGPTRTASIVNDRTGDGTPVRGEDFILEFEDGRRLKSSDFRLEAASDSIVHQAVPGQAGTHVVRFRSGDLRVRLVTTLHPEQWWATRHLEISGGSGRLSRVTLAQWRCGDVRGPSGSGKVVGALGYASGYGQPVYSGNLFFAIAHPGAENFVTSQGIVCRIPAYDELGKGKTIVTKKLIIGAGEAGAARRAFLGYIDATRAVPARMIFLVNDWYWKDKSQPLKAMRALARVKQESGVPVDSFTLDDGWDFDWDKEVGIWGRLGRKRFPGGWEALQAAGRPANINVSLWFGPIGGYSYRPKRIPFGREMGYEINGDKFCLAGTRYRRHVIESFAQWAERGMDYIKVDGFWPNCRKPDHGHPVGPGGAIAQMDALMEVFAAWHKARPGLVIGYTSGSNPSPFWLQHADFTWRGGRDDSHAGVGEPFDRHNTYLDSCLQPHRRTEMPISAFVTFDIVQHRIAGNSDEGFERGFWWLAARTSLHHDWYIQASDLTPDQWKLLARISKWAQAHEKVFRFSRMVGGDPGRGEVYGFAAFDDGSGTLALRNPSDKPGTIEGSLADWLDMPEAARAFSYRLRGVYGATDALDGVRPAATPFRVNLPPLAIAVFEVERANG